MPRAACGYPRSIGANLAQIEQVTSRVFVIPTDEPESDGTLSWNQTTVLVVKVSAGGDTGLGFSYTAAAAARIVDDVLAGALSGADALSPPAAWERMRAAVRNLGYPGVASSAVAAVDIALWDLKARLLGLPVAGLLGRVRERVPVYGSGGFTSQSLDELERQLGCWVQAGIPRVKMKVGSDPAADPERVRVAREAIGPHTELFVDANGAYQRKQALGLAQLFSEEANVTWFEEPVSSDDVDGLRLLRDRSPASMSIATGEYGYDLFYFRRLLESGAVDVLQADVTRCGGVTQMLRVASLCAAHGLALSAHTSPTLHAHVGSSIPELIHVEYFHDHARIEQLIFDGLPALKDGELCPDLSAPGFGLSLREADAAPYER